jgi:cytidylate kinase
MQNLLLKYLNERLEPKSNKPHEPGPVITISRECGCSGGALAQLLTEKINKKYREEGKFLEWKWINKEILGLASHELRMQPSKIKSLFETHQKNYFEELVYSFTETYYGQNEMVKKVIGDVIRKIALDGYTVIVGRGSGAIARDIPRSLHINLEAPLSWRVAEISQKIKMTIAEAKKFVVEVDKQRYNFKDYYRGKNNDDCCYDLSFNCKRLSNDEITYMIIQIAEYKHIL